MPLTIAMYHYVRNLARTRYPAIKGRDLKDFRGQLEHIAAHHTVVTTAEVIRASRGEVSLPDNAAWLTFDDGFSDHYDTVFPLLHERGWEGAFFVPAIAARREALLDVHQIHFILAAQGDLTPVIDRIRSFVLDLEGERAFDLYWAKLAHPNRFDPADVIFVKRILQAHLPPAPRAHLVAELFREFVSVDPRAFAEELYMSMDQLRLMTRSGMYVGHHGARHYWFNLLDPEAQRAEIEDGLGFLAEIGSPTRDWVMCYPFGAYDETTLSLLRDRECAIGLTTEVRTADVARDDPLRLPRLDTNDLPISL